MKDPVLVLHEDHTISNGNKNHEIDLPDMSAMCLVPYHIRVDFCNKNTGEVTGPAKDLVCRVQSHRDVIVYNEALFKLSNEINLSGYNDIRASGKIKLNVISRLDTPQRVRFTVSYEECIGDVIYHDRRITFGDTLQLIARSGRCTKLLLSASVPLSELNLTVNVVQDKGDEHLWPGSLAVSVGENDDESTIYTFDFTAPDMAEYPDIFRHMTLEAKARDSELESMHIYVVAYGFPHVIHN
jgi:hypothetical protein